jgi:hypothetical protein
MRADVTVRDMSRIFPLAVTVTVSVLLTIACSSAGSVQVVPQPVTARQAATMIGATGYTDCGPAPGGGITSSGIAVYHGAVYGFDAFADDSSRDAWVQTVKAFGIVPRLKGHSWVAYLPVGKGLGCAAI